MKMLVSIPPSPFLLIDADPGLTALQNLVDGSIEYLYVGRPDVAVYVNGSSLILGLMPNREANRLLRKVIGYDNLLCGTVVIVGADEDNDTDVPEEVVTAVTRGVWPVLES